MPNWCEGSLKVRGTIENLKRFIFEGLQPVDYLGEKTENLVNQTDDELSLFLETKEKTLWMKGTRRHFCEPDYIEVDAESKEDIRIVIMPMKAAWVIEAKSLLKLCKDFGVDMRIQAFESGMEFSQIIEIVNGNLIQNEEVKYDNWDWDCPCPLMGG